MGWGKVLFKKIRKIFSKQIRPACRGRGLLAKELKIMRKLIAVILFCCSCALPPVSQEIPQPPEDPQFVKDKEYCIGYAGLAAQSYEGLPRRLMYEHTLIGCMRDKGWDHGWEDVISH